MVKLTLREREWIQEAVRRFRKLVERSGLEKEMRRREYYEKPSEIKRRARLRASAVRVAAARWAALAYSDAGKMRPSSFAYLRQFGAAPAAFAARANPR